MADGNLGIGINAGATTRRAPSLPDANPQGDNALQTTDVFTACKDAQAGAIKRDFYPDDGSGNPQLHREIGCGGNGTVSYEKFFYPNGVTASQTNWGAPNDPNIDPRLAQPKINQVAYNTAGQRLNVEN